jgi:hypothetical protein
MNLTGLHLLLTYQCTLACDHCFVWGSPRQNGTMTLADIQHILTQAAEQGTVKTIFFEGGEPFLYYATLLKGVQEVVRCGFSSGIVTNAYWATSEADALEFLRPFAGLLSNLTISSDLLHWSIPLSQQSRNAMRAAEVFGIPTGMISVARPDKETPLSPAGLPYAEGKVMYRGRAAEKLTQYAPHKPWTDFSACPHENLRDPGRLHLDPLGFLHICQGISIGNILQTPLKEICTRFDPDLHPITGCIIRGGPAELIRAYDLPHADDYADACHLCYVSRRLLRSRFPAVLAPDQMYGR